MGANSSAISKVSGYQIGRLLPNSPAHVAGLCPFFDIITGVDDIALDLDSVDFFKEYITKNADTPLRLTLFNLRVRVFRVVTVTPSTNWGGVGLLGCAMEWSSAVAALELTWHIEAINPEGPAAECADLKAGRDYIIGMQAPDEPVVTLFTHSTFAEKMDGWRALRRTNIEMDAQERETLLLLIYDSDANAVKEVPVHMGHHTSLGVEIADGYLHFVPEVVVTDPAEVADKLPFVSKFVVNGGQQHLTAASNESLVVPADQQVPDVEVPSATIEAVPSPPPLPVPTAQSGAIKVPSFPSFLPSQGGQASPPYPGALPFPSFPMPPSVRPASQPVTAQ